jgi:hypothetical protein
MSGDPTEAVTESAKALQELAKAGGKAIDASRSVGGWLNRVFGQGIEDAVALHWSERIKARRIERAIYDWEKLAELMSKVEARLKAKGVHTLRLPPPKIALAIIENATIEDDDDLHSMWANLLATGLDPSADEIHKKYVSVLADLTGADAVVLRSLCEQWLDTTKKPGCKSYGSLTYGPTVDGTASHPTISIITLNRLGLISPGYVDFLAYEPNEDRSYKDPAEFHANDVRTYGNLDVVEVTDFGVAFYKAVLISKASTKEACLP